jgi:hypothetical protein
MAKHLGMTARLNLVARHETATRVPTMHRIVDHRPRWQDLAYATAFAVCCGALGALCGALVEVGIARLFV